MSWETEQWARQQRAGDPVRKAILVAVANEADTSGRNAFPSVKFIAFQCEVSERTVQRRLQELEDMCLLRRVKRFRPDGSQSSNGYDLIGYEPPLQFNPKEPKRRGDKLTPPPGDRMAGEGDAGDRGGVTMASPQRPNHLPIPPTAGEEDSPAVPPQGGLPLEEIINSESRNSRLGQKGHEEEITPAPPRPRRGARLPDDWTPPPVDTLPQPTQAVLKQWPPGAYEFVATGFAAHWTAENGARASKRDWRAAWIKWLSTEGPRVMAMAKSGIRFAEALTSRTDPAAAADIERLHHGEDDRVAALRGRLRADLGEQTYAGWLQPTAISIEKNAPGTGWMVDVFCPSRFFCDWVRQHFAPTIRGMAMKVLENDDVTVTCEDVGDR
jgi:hypothetical protein